MGHVDLAFLWHFHQPCYWDRVDKRLAMPWVRLHGAKDYTGFGLVLEEFPRLRCTANFSPVLLDQLDAYGRGVEDVVLELCRRRPAELATEEREFLRRQLFFAHPDQMIRVHPRYQELQEVVRPGGVLSEQDWIDLETLANLAWIHPLVLDRDVELAALVGRGRLFNLEDRDRVLGRQLALVAGVVPRWKALSDRGQVELSVSPYYHPILPLLCDASSCRESMPEAPVPANGTLLAADAAEQTARALRRGEEAFGRRPAGMWPSEGSVSPAACAVMAAQGARWTASDEEVLSRSLGVPFARDASGAVSRPELLYAPHRTPEGLTVVFRDQVLSNLVSFSYKTWSAPEAAEDFARRVSAAPDGSLVAVVLDGENPWEHYPGNGVPFLRALFGRLSGHPRIRTVTMSEAIESRVPRPLARIFSGSWIHHSFAVWAGHEEDRRAWDLVARVRRQVFEVDAPPEAKECVYAAEGSDWFWWFGEEYSSPQDPEFDALFRRHLGNACRLAGVRAPEELAHPVKRRRRDDLFRAPRGLLSVDIDGRRTDYFEWIAAGRYDLAREFGAMAGEASFLSDLYFGFGEGDLFVRFDFRPGRDARAVLADASVRLVALKPVERRIQLFPPEGPVRAAFGEILETAVPYHMLAVDERSEVEFHLEIERTGGVPIRVPSLAPLHLTVPTRDSQKLNWQA